MSTKLSFVYDEDEPELWLALATHTGRNPADGQTTLDDGGEVRVLEVYVHPTYGLFVWYEGSAQLIIEEGA